MPAYFVLQVCCRPLGREYKHGHLLKKITCLATCVADDFRDKKYRRDQIRENVIICAKISGEKTDNNAFWGTERSQCYKMFINDFISKN
jgi:hypothetical protein